MASESNKASMQSSLLPPYVFEGSWHVGDLLRGFRGHSEPSWGGLGASWSILGTILRHTWLSLNILRS